MRASDYRYLDHPGPIALADRGGSLHAPDIGRENALAACADAVPLGYRYLQTDVHTTRVGVVVHGIVTDRTDLLREVLVERGQRVA